MIRLPHIEKNWVDRAVEFVAPGRALQRLKARAALDIISGGRGGGYDSGRSDSKALRRYHPGNGSGITDVHPGMQLMRERSRDQARNNPLAAGAVNTVVTSSVGTGLEVQPNIDQEYLGMTEEEADTWEAQASRVWRLWANSTECDLEGEQDFGQIQGLTLRSILESGDILRIRRFLWDEAGGRPSVGAFGTKVQLVEADRVSNPNYFPDTTRLAGGVEVDHHGRVLQYWVRSSHPGEHLYLRSGDEWRPVPARHPTTGQRYAQLLFERRRVGQRRGVPYLAPVIEPLKQLDRYSDAELMAAVISSMFTVFVTQDVPEGGAGILDPIEGSAEAGLASTDPGEINLGHGSVVELAEGEGVSFADPTRPNDKFDPFVQAIVRQIGVALELPYEVLIKHFSSSYSASRGAILEAWKFFRTRRHLLVSWLCQPCYEDVIDEAVARGILDAPGYFDDPMVRRAYLGTQWTGDAMPQIDPKKEADAAKLRIDTGLSTIDREAREVNGSSFIENHRQRRKEARMRREDGLDIESVGEVVVSRSTSQQLPEGDEDNEGAAGDLETGDDETGVALLLPGDTA